MELRNKSTQKRNREQKKRKVPAYTHYPKLIGLSYREAACWLANIQCGYISGWQMLLFLETHLWYLRWKLPLQDAVGFLKFSLFNLNVRVKVFVENGFNLSCDYQSRHLFSWFGMIWVCLNCFPLYFLACLILNLFVWNLPYWTLLL